VHEPIQLLNDTLYFPGYSMFYLEFGAVGDYVHQYYSSKGNQAAVSTSTDYILSSTGTITLTPASFITKTGAAEPIKADYLFSPTNSPIYTRGLGYGFLISVNRPIAEYLHMPGTTIDGAPIADEHIIVLASEDGTKTEILILETLLDTFNTGYFPVVVPFASGNAAFDLLITDEEEAWVPGPGTSGTGDPTTPPPAGGSTGTGTGGTTSGTTALPATGDATMPVVAIALTLAAVGALVLIGSRRLRNRA
jgi:hypothetical protein